MKEQPDDIAGRIEPLDRFEQRIQDLRLIIDLHATKGERDPACDRIGAGGWVATKTRSARFGLVMMLGNPAMIAL